MAANGVGKTRLGWGLLLIAILVILETLLVGCSGPAEEGYDLERQGDLDGAVAVYSKALEEDPDNVDILIALAVDLLFLGKYDEALPVQEQVIALDPNEVQTRVELGFNYLNHQDRPADAVRVLSEAAALDPTAQHLTFLAQAQRVSGDEQTAEQTLRRALDADPEYAYSYTVLIDLLASQGRAEEAAQVKEEALLHGVQVEATQ